MIKFDPCLKPLRLKIDPLRNEKIFQRKISSIKRFRCFFRKISTKFRRIRKDVADIRSIGSTRRCCISSFLLSFLKNFEKFHFKNANSRHRLFRFAHDEFGKNPSVKFCCCFFLQNKSFF